MKILAIETSCDETAIAVIEYTPSNEAGSWRVLGNALFSQIELHKEFGGVFPMLAKREHGKNIAPLLQSALDQAYANGLQVEPSAQGADQAAVPHSSEQKTALEAILSREEGVYNALQSLLNGPIPAVDAIAVTEGPGLEPALWVGISVAKALSMAWQKPLIPINHMEGHIASVLLSDAAKNAAGAMPTVAFPALALLISGGHTELVLVRDWHDYKVIGKTLDDAVGEAFDKVARILGLPYPGGPEISKLAAAHRAVHPTRTKEDREHDGVALPRPMLHSGNLDFSFSGIKTAALYLVQKLTQNAGPTGGAGDSTTGGDAKPLSDETRMAVAREFEDAVTEVLVAKAKCAAEESEQAGQTIQSLIIGGGVIANTYIREQFKIFAKAHNITLYTPSHELSTDNAIMIGVAGALHFSKNTSTQVGTAADTSELRARGNLSL